MSEGFCNVVYAAVHDPYGGRLTAGAIFLSGIVSS